MAKRVAGGWVGGGGGGVCASRHAAGHSNSTVRKKLIYIYNKLAAGANGQMRQLYRAGSISADIEPLERSSRQSGP